MIPSKNLSRNLTLDSLRALAAISVLVHHVFNTTTKIGDAGAIGVYLFFLISGYCIVLSLSNLGEQPIRGFLIRRLFRLYPVYWIAVIFAKVSAVAPVPWSNLLINLSMFQTAFRVPDINGVFWTLFIELVFYGFIIILLIFGFAYKISTYALGWLLFTAGSLFAALTWRFAGIHIPFAHMLFLSLFMMGGTVSMIHKKNMDMKWVCSSVILYLAVVYAISYAVFSAGGESTLFIPQQYFGNYAFAVIFFLFALWRRWFAWSWLSYLGKISFCIYLFHGPIITFLEPLVSGIVFFILVLMLSLSISAVLNKFVEEPFIEIGRRLAK
jgi:peptidoglycan/LPS O-acetylase OafA/YrhL